MAALTIKSLSILCIYIIISGPYNRLVVVLTHQCTLVVVWVAAAAVTWGEVVVLAHIIEVSLFTVVFSFGKAHEELDSLCAQVPSYWGPIFYWKHGISLIFQEVSWQNLKQCGH